MKETAIAGIRKWPGRRLPWSVDWREPETKKQRWKYFATKREAEAFRSTVDTELRQGTYVDRGRPVQDVRHGLAGADPAHGQPEHARPPRVALNSYLVPAFNLMAIQSSAGPDRAVAGGPPGQGQAGAAERADYPGVLNTILEDARAKGYIFVNPMAQVRRFDIPERELHYLDVLQVKKLVNRSAPSTECSSSSWRSVVFGSGRSRDSSGQT
jgi:hypothetical protein